MLRPFFRRIRLSLTRPSSYRELRGVSFWRGVRYLYGLLVLAAYITAVLFAIRVAVSAPDIRTFLDDAKGRIRDLYPANLVLTFENGKLRTNVQEPYVFPIPGPWEDLLREAEDGEAEFDHLLTINTSADIADYPAARSLFLMTETALVAPDKGGSYQVFPYRNVGGGGTFVFNRDVYESVVVKVLPFLDSLLPILAGLATGGFVFLPWIGAAFFLVGELLFLLVFTLPAWLVDALMKRRLGYGTLYRLGLYALTPAVIVQFALTQFGTAVPFLPTAVFLVMMGLVIKAFPVASTRRPQSCTGTGKDAGLLQ